MNQCLQNHCALHDFYTLTLQTTQYISWTITPLLHIWNYNTKRDKREEKSWEMKITMRTGFLQLFHPQIGFTMVVYMCSNLLQLAPGSCDFSQAEKRITVDNYFHSKWQFCSFRTIFNWIYSAGGKSRDPRAKWSILEHMYTNLVTCYSPLLLQDQYALENKSFWSFVKGKNLWIRGLLKVSCARRFDSSVLKCIPIPIAHPAVCTTTCNTIHTEKAKALL